MSKTKTPMRLMIDIASWQAETIALTAAQRGALLSLKMFYWRNGSIPDRDQSIAQIVGMDLKEWKKARHLLEPLFIIGEGEWFRTDWSEELEAAYAAVNTASKAGKKANKVRWDKQKCRLNGSDSESGKESDSDPSSLLKYTSPRPSQEMDGFVSGDSTLEQAVSALEADWKEVGNV